MAYKSTCLLNQNLAFIQGVPVYNFLATVWLKHLNTFFAPPYHSHVLRPQLIGTKGCSELSKCNLYSGATFSLTISTLYCSSQTYAICLGVKIEC